MFLPRKEKNKILPFIQCSITFAPRLQRRLTSEYLLKERGHRIMFHAFYFNSLHSTNTSPNHLLLRTHSTERHSQVNRNRAFSHCKFAVHSTQIISLCLLELAISFTQQILLNDNISASGILLS